MKIYILLYHEVGVIVVALTPIGARNEVLRSDAVKQTMVATHTISL